MDPTISRLVRALADAGPTAWALAGTGAPDHGATARTPLILDVDATLVTARSDKEGAAPTFKRGFGEPLAFLLRPGNAGSNTATDHIEVIKSALVRLPGYEQGRRPGKGLLVRIDGATHALLGWLTARRLGYFVGFTRPGDLAANQAMFVSLPSCV